MTSPHLWIVPPLAAFLSSLSLPFLFAPLAPRVGAMDQPKPLSIHSTPTPRTGGLAVLAGFLVALGLALVAVPGLSVEDKVTLLGISVACVAVAAIGLLDDMGRIPTWVEVSALLVPATLVVLLGLRVGFAPLAYVSVPLTLFYLVGGCSSINLLDGMNGMAGGVAGIASSFFAYLCLGRGDTLGTVLSLALLGAVVGFLPFNFPRATIFLGDNGSLFVGFLLAILAARSSSQPYHFGSLAGPVLVLVVPVGDTFLAIMRRVLNRGQVLSGDRRHVYDLLRARGLGDVKTVLALWSLAACGGFLGLLAYGLDDLPSFALLVLSCSLFFAFAIWLGAARAGPDPAQRPAPRTTDAGSPLRP